MLNERRIGYTYLELAGGKGFIKQYVGGETALFAFLPPEGESLDTYLGKISGSAFCSAYEKRKQVILVSKLPMFTFDYYARLENPLMEMGMKQAFTDYADFSGMSDSPVRIDSVIHKTHIDLDQNGTKAAAVTAIISKATAMPFYPKLDTVEIILNRPFVYGIMDTRTATPLFVGVADSIK
jgi:serpin B